jgi:hypothetical protein
MAQATPGIKKVKEIEFADLQSAGSIWPKEDSL